jgi:hypothetical protein
MVVLVGPRHLTLVHIPPVVAVVALRVSHLQEVLAVLVPHSMAVRVVLVLRKTKEVEVGELPVHWELDKQENLQLAQATVVMVEVEVLAVQAG